MKKTKKEKPQAKAASPGDSEANLEGTVIEDNNIEYFIIGDNNTIHIHIHHHAGGGKEVEVEVENESGSKDLSITTHTP